jgi:hypothetical protein
LARCTVFDTIIEGQLDARWRTTTPSCDEAARLDAGRDAALTSPVELLPASRGWLQLSTSFAPLPSGITLLEAALGGAVGENGLDRVPSIQQPDLALAAALLPALRRPPCLIAFSGGRDSSLLLATATRTARAEGLPEPIPVTITFPADGQTEEAEWQDLALAHVRCTERITVAVDTELDAIGELARGCLRRIGPYEPFDAHFILPLLGHARGGSLVVGVGGDELLAPGRWGHLQRLPFLPERVPPPRTMVAAAVAAMPGPIGVQVLARRAPELPWIAPSARRRAALLWAADHNDPLRFDAQVRRAGGRRTLHNMIETLNYLAAPDDVVVHAPLLDSGVVRALANAGGAFGFGGRVTATRVLAGPDGLPERLLTRSGKRSFDVPLWGRETRRFAEAWSGTGFDPGVVDAEALRAAWLADTPDHRSGLLLHAAWCHDNGVGQG